MGYVLQLFLDVFVEQLSFFFYICLCYVRFACRMHFGFPVPALRRHCVAASREVYGSGLSGGQVAFSRHSAALHDAALPLPDRTEITSRKAACPGGEGHRKGRHVGPPLRWARERSVLGAPPSRLQGPLPALHQSNPPTRARRAGCRRACPTFPGPLMAPAREGQAWARLGPHPALAERGSINGLNGAGGSALLALRGHHTISAPPRLGAPRTPPCSLRAPGAAHKSDGCARCSTSVSSSAAPALPTQL